MQSIIDVLKERASQAIRQVFDTDLKQIAECLPAEITQSTQKQFGHYQCNSALKLAKLAQKNPRSIANALVEQLKIFSSQDDLIAHLEVAGPGFINITIGISYIAHELMLQLKDPYLGVVRAKTPLKVIVEFSSPNIAKELHVGHLRSTIIGESLARLFEFLGYDVLRLNHVGDWGTQFGMLIAYLKKFQPQVLTGEYNPLLTDLMTWYKKSKQVFDEDPSFKKMAQEEVVALQGLSKNSIQAWERICEISRKAFQAIYDLLDVTLQERGESYYNPMLPKVVADLEKKGLVAVDEGAKCVFLEGFTGQDGKPLPMIIQKSDGGYNYSTTDLAALRHRVDVEKASRIIYVVDAGQSLHFQMLFKAAQQAGYLDPRTTKIEHVAFGVVLGADGKKFKTRSGETERLIDLLTQAVVMAKSLLKERMPEISDELLEERARVLGIDAVKYADLSGHRLKDYAFSYDRMLKFEGNTAAFLLYSYVRIQSIKKKTGKDPAQVMKSHTIVLSHPTEIDLGLHLRRFGEALQVVEQELLPHRLCDYLYQLAEYFNAFFRDCRVEGADEANSRILLCELTARVLEKGLFILGLKTLDRM
jgi:arginyl-tRNA synthetase